MTLTGAQAREQIVRAGWSVLRVPATEGHGRTCESCGLPLGSAPAYRVPGVGGVYCSVGCVETALFGQEHCRWCGTDIEKPYTSIDSRLCSSDCSENYYAHVLGDRTAALGTGKRLLLWLQRRRPQLYRQLAGQSVPTRGACQNPECKRGDDGQPASLVHLRKGSRYCSNECRKYVHKKNGPKEVLNSVFDPSETPVLRGVSRPPNEELDLDPIPGVQTPKEALIAK